MREILFRGKTKETHEWVYGGFCEMDGRYFIVKAVMYPIDNTCSWGAYEVDPKTVGQFIGKVDKNDRMIFEGDLCLIKTPTYIELVSRKVDDWNTMLCRCERDEIYTGFICRNKVGDPYVWYNVNLDLPDEYCELVEVVGNIHDNPDYICPVCGNPWNSKHDPETKEPCRACGEFI